MRTDDLSIEAKYTDAKQFTLKNVDLLKAEQYALIDGRDSVFVVSFSGRDEWAIIREEEYAEYRQMVRDYEELRSSYNALRALVDAGTT